MVERFVYTEDVGSSSLSSPTSPLRDGRLSAKPRCLVCTLAAQASQLAAKGGGRMIEVLLTPQGRILAILAMTVALFLSGGSGMTSWR